MFHTEIHIQGKLTAQWSDWFDEMQVLTGPAGDTILCGDLTDKAAVYGVISRLSSLGFTLISVTCQEKPQDPPV